MKLRFVKFYKYMVENLMTVQFLSPSSRKAMVKILMSNRRTNVGGDYSSFTEGEGRA